MHQRANTIFYVLSSFLLMAGLFVFSPSKVPEVTSLQTEIQKQFSIAWQGTIGDQPYFEELYAIIEGVDEFYSQAADQMIVLLDPKDNDQDLVYTVAQTYRIFATSFKVIENKSVASTQEADEFVVPSNFMAEEPIYNIVPESQISDNKNQITGIIAGTTLTEPVNLDQPWVTMMDNFTGQIYCVALYNGEVNKYLGPCKNEYQ